MEDPNKEINEIGCYYIAGAIIRKALFDYQFYGKKMNRQTRTKSDKNQYRHYHDSAEAFLFRRSRLESWLEITGLDRIVNIDYIRYVAKHVDILQHRREEFFDITSLEQKEEEKEI